MKDVSVLAGHTVPSSQPAAMRRPSLESDSDATGELKVAMMRTSRPLESSEKMRTVQSSDPDTRFRQSGVNASEVTVLLPARKEKKKKKKTRKKNNGKKNKEPPRKNQGKPRKTQGNPKNTQEQ